MKYFVCLFLCLTTALLFSQSNPLPPAGPASAVPPIAAQSDPKAQATILDSYGKLPLSFEANYGQTDPQVKFLSRTGAYSLFLTGDEAVFVSSPKTKVEMKTTTGDYQVPSKTANVLRMKLRNANPAAKVVGADELSGENNYFIGNDPKEWRTGVPTYAKVKYEGIYSGIDLVYYGNQQQLEYDFIVAPGADPRRIAFDVRGAKWIRRDAHGELVFKMGEDEIRWYKPVVYQEKDGARQEIVAHYAITDRNRVEFVVAKYDATKPLYIDPLIYSTFLGGGGWDSGNGIVVDSSGNAYVTGWTASSNFPVTPGAFQTTCGDGYGCRAGGDAFVTKFNSAGSALVYSTYLGGSDYDLGYGIAADSAGNAYVIGQTQSSNFPVTPGAFQATCGNCTTGYGNAFVTEINTSGSALVYSTYLGGSEVDVGLSIAVDSSGNAYVTGETCSTDFPVTPGAYQTTFGGGSCPSFPGGDAFVTKLNPSGSALVYSTYLGGSEVDVGYGIAADSAGNAYVIGSTGSTNFPVTPGAFQTVCGGACAGNAFVTKLNPSGSALLYSTYLGGSKSDYGQGIAVDSSGNAYVTGWTASSNFPVTPGAFQTTCNGNGDCDNVDVFITKVNPTGSILVYSTYLGGISSDYGQYGTGIVVDSSGNAYVTGYTYSTQFPITPGAFQRVCNVGKRPKCDDYGDAFAAKINPTGSALAYSTYLDGSKSDYGQSVAIDNMGNAYVTGQTHSTNFPVTPGAFQTTYGGGYGNAFVAKIDMKVATTITLLSSPNPSTYGEDVTFTAVVGSSIGSPPDGQTVSFMKGKVVLGTGTLSGGSASFTTSTLKVGTNSITAVYGGDSNFAGSTSKPVKQVVEKAGEASLFQR